MSVRSRRCRGPREGHDILIQGGAGDCGAGDCGAGGTVSAFGVLRAIGINSSFGMMEASRIVSALVILGCGASVRLTGVAALIGP